MDLRTSPVCQLGLDVLYPTSCLLVGLLLQRSSIGTHAIAQLQQVNHAIIQAMHAECCALFTYP